MSKYLVLSVVAVLICAATSAFAATIYTNDFGTSAQRSEMTIVGDVSFDGNGWWGDYNSNDGDGNWSIANILPQPGYGTVATLTKQVMAPTGQFISYPSLDASLGGHDGSWGTNAGISLSRDGINWDHMVWCDYENSWGIGYTSSAASDPLYKNLSSVWIRLTLHNYGGNNPGLQTRGQGSDLVLRGTLVPVPEPGSMLALGSGLVGLVGFAVRRRK